MKTFIRRRRTLGLAALAAITVSAGCTDLTGDLGGAVVSGLTIEDTGGGTVVTVGSSGSVSGTLTVARNAQRPMAILLRSANGSVVLPGINETVRVTITNPNVASWAAVGGGTGTLRGHTAGSTSMTVDVIQSGTVEYTSPPIPIQVN
ncbi:MAG TPA: hypothetical protein VGC13_08380 [Longimicrobium sp.]|jgi:hypothetical protein|uniref:hypothetical protein n=1 Tax=Longimicrobium sp. TaxID=2029185 RepID=UPI002EDA644B